MSRYQKDQDRIDESGVSYSPDSKSQEWTNRFDFLALAGWLMISLGLAVVSYLWFGIDFRGYYAATRVFMAGGNPFDYRQVAQVLLSVTGSMGNNPYYYPPWFVWLFVPIAWLPFRIARAVWMVFNLLAWNFSLWKLSELLDWPQKGWRRYSFFILSTLTFGWITWRFEQAGILVFAILVAVIIAIHHQKWIQTGLLLSLLLIKPNVTFVVVVAISLWLIRNGYWKPVWALVISLILLLTISTLLTPDWYRPFLEPGFGQGLSMAIDGPNKMGPTRINTTIFDWLVTLGIGAKISWLIYGVCAVLGMIFLFRSIKYSKSLLHITSAALLVSYLLTPYALQYDYPPLVIVLFWARSSCNSSKIARFVGNFLTGFIFSVSIWQRNIAWGFWIVVGSIAIYIWGFFNQPGIGINDMWNARVSARMRKILGIP